MFTNLDALLTRLAPVGSIHLGCIENIEVSWVKNELIFFIINNKFNIISRTFRFLSPHPRARINATGKLQTY